MIRFLLISLTTLAGLYILESNTSRGSESPVTPPPSNKAEAPATVEKQVDSDAPEEILLLIRADDLGSSHAANVACIRTYRDGIVRSVEVMVPCPWFSEAVGMLAKHPDLDVGIHLTLTSEWENCRWGPLTRAPSLVGEDSCFFPTTSQRQDFPPNTGFLQSPPDPDEVEKELRAQIELALQKIKGISHITCHMGTPTANRELREITEKLSREYKLPVGLPGVKPLRPFRAKMTPREKVGALVKALEDIVPGVWLLVDHPAMDTPEMRAIGHAGYRDVALDREGVTQAFTAKEVKDLVKKRGIRLVSYADVLKKAGE